MPPRSLPALATEATALACTNGLDDDGDGHADCADLDCALSPAVTVCRTGAEASLAACGDGFDNDGDGAADCADADCESWGCVEATAADCSDASDNDGDGAADCDDVGCRYGCALDVCGPRETLCQDTLDNDNDGLGDCLDPDCHCAGVCGVRLGEATRQDCTDALDNDGDELVDCADAECAGLLGKPLCDGPVGGAAEVCADEVDNDTDGFTDCHDLDCVGAAHCEERGDVACADGIDNDADGYVDCLDRGCLNDCPTWAVASSPENSPVACSDGLDNDADGRLDCTDQECWTASSVPACAPPSVALGPLAHPTVFGAAALPTGATARLIGVLITAAGVPDEAENTSCSVSDPGAPLQGGHDSLAVLLPRGEEGPPTGARVDLWLQATTVHGLRRFVAARVDIVSGPQPVGALRVASSVLRRPATASALEGRTVLLENLVVVEAGVLCDDFARSACVLARERSAPGSWPPVLVAGAPGELPVGAGLGYVSGVLRRGGRGYTIQPRSVLDVGDFGVRATDSDADHVLDWVEAGLRSDPTSVDSDGDGVVDEVEVIDPGDPQDTDCDGQPDLIESSIEDSDGDGVVDDQDADDLDGPTADADADGIVNALDLNDDGDVACDPGVMVTAVGDCSKLADNCASVSNDDQGDQDQDGIGDACDPDVDGDGHCNRGVCAPVEGQCDALGDNCVLFANVDQEDRDGDGDGDACDPDDDNDRICEAQGVPSAACELPGGKPDNCPLLRNADQLDADLDDIGDACDFDDDNDGVCDPGVEPGAAGCVYVSGSPDNCPTLSNPDQQDSDSDGYGDACQALVAGLAPPAVGRVLISEVMVDPLGVDVNRDGVPSASGDEFVELVNVGGVSVDLRGCAVAIDGLERHRFEPTADPAANVVAAKGAVVVFAMGAPVGRYGGAKVRVASTGLLALGNAGGTVALTCAGTVVDQITYSGSKVGVAWTRAPESDAQAPLVLHDSVSTLLAFSPGACSSGLPTTLCLP